MKSPHNRFWLSFIALAIVAAPTFAQTLRSDAEASRIVAAFGGAVDIENGTVFVGEPNNSVTPGYVYAFNKVDGEWMESSRLEASNGEASNGFGRVINAAGDYVIVGATDAAYLYTMAGDSWSETILSGSAMVEGDNFGSAVAIMDDRAFVGAPTPPEAPGSVTIFKADDNGAWSEHHVLNSSEAKAGDRFGSVVATGGGYLFAAATRADSAAGAVFVYKHDDETHEWTELAKLSGSDSEPSDRFGSAIHYSQGFLLIGAPRHDGFRGKVYIFAETPAGFQEVTTLVPFDGDRGFQFGTSIASEGNDIWIGVPGSSNFAGAVYIHTATSDKSDWASINKLSVDDVSQRDFASSAIAVENGVGVIGIVGDDYGAGTVAIFEKDEDMKWVSSARLGSPVSALQAVTGGEVTCSEGKASAFECSKVNLASFMPTSDIGGKRGVKVNDIWGWTDPESGKEYALVGRNDGTSFVDVSDPYNPVYIGNLWRTEGTPGSTWRDVKTYKNHAYIVADGAGNHGVQVFDLTLLRNFDGSPIEFEAVAHYDEIASAHNIVINEDTGFAYTVGNSAGGETCGGGSHIINIQNPTQPTFAGCFAHENTGRRGTGYTHDAQCVTYKGPDSEHVGKEICFAANETALSIGDVTDKQNTIALSQASYPKVGYSHQGWLTEDHQFFFMNDELDELGGNVEYTRTLIWDVSDLDDPQLLKEYLSEQKASDHNLYIRGNYVYQSNYQAGLRILDITDVANPVEVGYFDTVPYGTNDAGFGGSWSNYPYFESGIIIVTSGDEGLFVVKQSDLGI
ncbi:MAG: choice-of-anchor B family protein [Rhodothermales bacterium]|nr:choice-of-anchor B family protein [Rhodothermales bacterium]